MTDENALLTVLDTLSAIARHMHPRRLAALVAKLEDQDTRLHASITDLDALAPAAILALRACAGLRAAPTTENPTLAAYRAMRHYSLALEALTPAINAYPATSRYLLEPRYRDDPATTQHLAQPPHPDSGIYHFDNETNQRGGFSVYVPSWYSPDKPASLVTALHGGSGHGRLFLWNWLPEARARGLIVVAPTAVGSTWSLMDPEIDSQNLNKILTTIKSRWSIDPTSLLLTGMSDGGSFTLLSGLHEDSPFTHLAPVAASFHPLLLSITSPDRLTNLPIYLTHGAQDWMFPVDTARLADRTLASAGAAITYNEIADLAHAYPRDAQPGILDWWLKPA